MKSRTGSTARRTLAVVVLVAAMTLGLAPAASAADLHGAETLAFGSLSDFLNTRDDPDRDSGYDWSSDGCTTPQVDDLARWNDFFRRACWRHDFGYSNFGYGEEFAVPTEEQRYRVDLRFRNDMYELCAPLSFFRRAECRLVAYAYYSVVRRVGGFAYFA